MTSHPRLAHQFDDMEQQHLTATLGMWAFLATEVLFFGGLFAGYTVYRAWYPEEWAAASRHLDLVLGTLNTVVLLTSSLTMALAVSSAHRSDVRGVQRFLCATIGLGLIFIAVKTYEYYHKWHERLVPGPGFQWGGTSGLSEGPLQLFYSFYYAMTGCHALHMLIGFGLLGTLWWQAGRGRFSSSYTTPVDNVGLYWHFVDIVWVFLFPLLYLVDRT